MAATNGWSQGPHGIVRPDANHRPPLKPQCGPQDARPQGGAGLYAPVQSPTGRILEYALREFIERPMSDQAVRCPSRHWNARGCDKDKARE